jgi:soluble lytic murein transglycosylase
MLMQGLKRDQASRRFLAPAALAAAPVAAAAADAASSEAQAAPRPDAVLTDRSATAYRESSPPSARGDWAGAAARLDAMPRRPAPLSRRAELYLAKGSPKVELEPLLPLIAKAPDLPQAEQLARSRNARRRPSFPLPCRPRSWSGRAASRAAPARKSTKGDPAATELERSSSR